MQNKEAALNQVILGPTDGNSWQTPTGSSMQYLLVGSAGAESDMHPPSQASALIYI